MLETKLFVYMYIYICGLTTSRRTCWDSASGNVVKFINYVYEVLITLQILKYFLQFQVETLCVRRGMISMLRFS
jgi:hypothetical protein